MRVVVLGVGYVGLPTALLLARAGHEVLAVDIDPAVVAQLGAGRAHLEPAVFQPLLDEPDVRRRISASTSPAPGDAFLITVPTPVDATGRAADLSMVESAAGSIVALLRPGNLVVVESTVPPGTCERVVQPILESGGLAVPGDVRLAHAPERVFPGDMLRELVTNERLVGGVDDASTAAAAELYGSFVTGAIHRTDARTAELAKLLENTYRDVNIAFANEVASLAAAFAVDPIVAIDLANRHPRVNILQPGIGVGGHCIPIDPWFLVAGSGDRARLVPAAREVNDGVPERIAAAISRSAGPGQRVLLLGATYKPDVADTRGAPAAAIRRHLSAAGHDVVHLDPLAPGYDYADLGEAVADAGLVVVLVPHRRIMQDLAALPAPGPGCARILQVRDLVSRLDP